MNGSYLITDLSQEAAIAKIMLKIIKDSLENQKFYKNIGNMIDNNLNNDE
jgi:ribosomal protein S3AE